MRMRTRHFNPTVFLALAAVWLGWTGWAAGLDRVTLSRDGKEIQIEGRLLVTAQDGGLLLLAPDGMLWAVPPEEQVKHVTDEAPFRPLSSEEMAERLLAKLPEGFSVYQTAHYTICHDTSRAYAQWCGSLFERLYRAFTNYWTRKGVKLSEPELPLVAIVFSDRARYVEFSRAELGEAAGSIIGHYSLQSNLMTMYDLTGLETLSQFRNARGTLAQISSILAQPEAVRQVATIVHEATHQIAFNCGLHTRYSDCPLWLSEGIAVFCETPDLRSTKGWRGIGAINQPRLEQFQEYLGKRPAGSLRSLIADDTRFRDPKQSLDAYGEAWALTYFLIHRRADQYVKYLKMISQKKPLLFDSPEVRLKQFTEVFGDLEALDSEFLRYMVRVR
jgi:hypothetical protein